MPRIVVVAALLAALTPAARAQAPAPRHDGVERGLILACALDAGPQRPGAREPCEPVGTRPAPDRTGRPGGAVQLDGVRAHVVVRDRVAPERFTLSAWVRPDTVDRPGVIVSKIRNLPGHYQKNFELRIDPGGRLFLHVPGGAQWDGVAGTRPLQPGRWTHVAATYDGARAQLWVNGTRDGAPLAVRYAQTDAEVFAGARPEGGGADGRKPAGPAFFLAGALDDLRIHDRALAEAELGILASAAPGAPAPHPGPPAPVPAPPPAAPQPVAELPLDGDARDLRGPAGRALAARPAEDRDGRAGGALAFDGRGLVDLGMRVEPETLSVAAWVRPDRLGREMALVSKSSGLERGRDVLVELRLDADGRPAFTLPGRRPQTIRGARPLAAGRWVHLAATFDGDRAILYVDGVPEAEAAVAGWAPVRGPLFLAARPEPSGRRARPGTGLEGRLDAVTLWRGALDAREVARLARPGRGDRDDAQDLLAIDRLLVRFDAACAARERAALARVEERVMAWIEAERKEARDETRGRGARERLARLDRAAAEFRLLRGRTDALALDRKRAALAELSEAAWLELAEAIDEDDRWTEGAARADDEDWP